MPDLSSKSPTKPLWQSYQLSRRRFLALVSGATALIVQACQNTVPEPTPSPTSSPAPTQAPIVSPTTGSEVHLPLVAKSEETPTSSPTKTKKPSPTKTKKPSPTKTSSPTATVQPTSPPQPTITPEPTAIFEPTVTPEPTAIPEPTVTPEPTALPEPTLAPEATATAEAVSIPEPTELALSEATATSPPQPPEPTATLSSQATPFPPGPATKLGFFIGYQHPKLLEILQTGNIPFIKTLEYDPNLMEFIKQTSPNTIIVARYSPLPQVHLANFDPIGEARRFVELLLPIASEPKRQANIDAWEAYNEPVANNSDEMKRLAEFEAERTRLLGQAGIRSCIGNFATGQPALELWPDFFPALQAAREYNGYLGLHEYSAPYMWFGYGSFQLQEGVNEGDEGWLTLRYRKAYRKYIQPAGLELPLLITETGIDGQVGNRPGPGGLGWQDFQGFWKNEGMVRNTAPGFYVEQLAWYDAELQQDYYVKGASIFALAAPSGWGSFELLGSCADLLQQYISVHPRR